MNITREQTGDLTAVVKMEIQPEDYQEKVDKILVDYKKKASIPGFRPGHVPVGLIRKMYGRAVLAEEVNKLIGEGITNYIRDEKLNILGNPLPNAEKNNAVNFETDTAFTFYFDLGLAPDFTVDMDALSGVENLVIRIDDPMLDKYILEIRERHGDYIHPETSADGDLVSGEAVEIYEAGEETAGIVKNLFLHLDRLTVEATRQSLTGISKDDTVILKPAQSFSTLEDAAQQLGLKPEEVSKDGLTFRFTVKDVVRKQPAGLDGELFTKAFPGEDIQTEDAFRARVRKDLAASFAGETEKLLFNRITAMLVEKTMINLPDEFMKRWLLEHNEGKYTPDQIEKEYPVFLESMKWQLIENKLIRDHNIQVADEDIRKYIREVMIRRMFQSVIDPETEQRFESIVDSIMENKEQVQRINDQLYNERLLTLFREHRSINEREVSYDEFIGIVSGQSAHHHEHDHTHDHDHDHDGDHDHDPDHDHKH